MDRAEMVTLIQDGVPPGPGTWADLGAGTGNFTWALSELLAPESVIYAVDRDARAIQHQQALIDSTTPAVAIRPMQADFTQPLKLPHLDGILMANALHFIRDQPRVLRDVLGYLAPGGRFLLVEYAVESPLRYVPYPVPLTRFAALAADSGLTVPRLVRTRRSPSSGIVLYAAVATQLN